MENEALVPEIVETAKEAVKRGNVTRDAKGRILPGSRLGPPRAKGTLNKFSQVKEDILSAWKKGKGKERFLKLVEGSPSDYKVALQTIVSILPKESTVDIDMHTVEKIILIRANDHDK